MNVSTLFSKSRLASLLIACAVTLCVTSSAAAQTVTLGWDANTETDLSGYMVLWGTSSGVNTGVYPNSVTLGKVTSTQIGPLTGGTTYYFVVKALNTSGFTSTTRFTS